MANNEKEKLVLTLIAAIIISLLINMSLLFTLVDPYLHDTNRVVNIFDFYDRIQRDSENRIFFLGSSQTAGDLNATIVEDLLRQQNLSVQVFNLGYSADTPLRRVTELDKLIKAKPKMVIICLTYYGLNDPSFPISSDSLALVAGDIRLDSYSRFLFQKDELDLIGESLPSIYVYKRKFIIPSIQHFFLGKNWTSDEDLREFKNPENFRENLTRDLLLIRLNNSRDMLDKYIVYREDNVQKKALNHTISQLAANGILVKVVNMPLNPLLSEKITNETRYNYFSMLNSTAIRYYDLESCYPPEYFSDLTHLNNLGKLRFSEDMAQIILENKGLYALQ